MSRDVQGNFSEMGSSIRIGEPSSTGPCDSNVWRTPGGKQTFLGGLPSTTSRRTDRVRSLGPNLTERVNSGNILFGVRSKSLGGEKIVRRVFAAALLGCGTD